MSNNNPVMALQTKEGEIPTEDSTPEGEEPEEGGDLELSAPPNVGEDWTEHSLADGEEHTLAGSSSLGGS